MATINRIKNKKKSSETSYTQQQQPVANSNSQPVSFPIKTKNSQASSHTAEKQSIYQSYYQMSQCNPIGVSTTSTLFPCSNEMQAQYNVPLGFIFSPLMFLENQNSQIMSKSIDKIPNCPLCGAYMNCYNTIEKNKFICFFCRAEGYFGKQYDPSKSPNNELNSPIYQAIGSENFYQNQPKQQAYVFLVDINRSASNTKMLYYAVAAMKQVLARPQLDEICIYFFTYDEIVHHYDFSGEDIKCTIMDSSIQEKSTCTIQPCFLKDIREKLFNLLDSLQQLSQDNLRSGSNFTKCFDYVFSNLKHTGAKFFILQSNQAIADEQIFKEEKSKSSQTIQPKENKIKNFYETNNKLFFNKYLSQFVKNNCSFSFYIFAKNYKNVKVLMDSIKLTNSQLRVYSKDSQVNLDQFYYQFSFYLGANYFKNVILEFRISFGWNFTAIYGNFKGIQNQKVLVFEMPILEASKKVVAFVNPFAPQHPQKSIRNPYCAIQIITNYLYKRQYFICVSTIVQSVTGNKQRLYASIDPPNVIACLAKGFLASLRMEPIKIAHKKILQSLQTFKKPIDIPDSIITIVTSVLGMLKSLHAQPQIINNSTTLDRIMSERNFLQFTGSNELSILFNPYMFDLTHMDNTMCRQDIEFVYPTTIQPKFVNTKEGLYLMDNGLALYLFIAKKCDPDLLQQVFGQSKFTKNDILNQDTLMQQGTFKANQIQTLIKFLREQKSIGWSPLYVIRCGQNTLNEKNFYLNFYQQKYSQFRSFNMNVQEFRALISKPNLF